jgi:hypothetical protein
MKKGIIIGTALVGIIIAIIVWDTSRKDDQITKIKANLKQTTCKVIGHDIPKKSSDTHYGVWIEYEYTVAEKSYKHKKKYYFPKDDEKYFVGQSFPLVYDATDPDLNRILIIDSDFSEFNIPQPDSLKQYNGKIR